MRQQFPVSSGQTHSLALNEWVPIGPEESAKLNKILKPDEGNKLPSKSHHSHQAPKAISVRFQINIIIYCKILFYKNCLIQAEPVIQPISSPNNAVVPMDYQYVSPAVEPPAFVTPYVNENIKVHYLSIH